MNGKELEKGEMKMGKDQRDLFGGMKARDEGMARVSANGGDWTARAITYIARIPKGFMGTGQDFKLRAFDDGLDSPHHHNAWGAVIRTAIRKGLIRGTGLYGHTVVKASHARVIPIYVKK